MHFINQFCRFTLGLALATALIINPILAQQRPTPLKRGQEIESGADTLSVQLYQAVGRNGQFSKIEPAINPADPLLRFKSGEYISVVYSLNFDGYIYFVNVGPEGTRVIYPDSVDDIQLSASGRREEITLMLDENVGREELIIIVARERITRLDRAVSRRDKMLDARTTSLPPATLEANDQNIVPAVYRPAPNRGQSSTPPTAQGTQQLAPAAPVDQPAAPKKGSKMKTVGIVAGGIALNILGSWLGTRFAAPGIGQIVSQAGTQLAAPTTDPSAQQPATQDIPQGNGAGTTKQQAPLPPGMVARGLELITDRSNQIRAYPTAAQNGSSRLTAGQVATFRVSFDHR